MNKDLQKISKKYVQTLDMKLICLVRLRWFINYKLVSLTVCAVKRLTKLFWRKWYEESKRVHFGLVFVPVRCLQLRLRLALETACGPRRETGIRRSARCSHRRKYLVFQRP